MPIDIRSRNAREFSLFGRQSHNLQFRGSFPREFVLSTSDRGNLRKRKKGGRRHLMDLVCPRVTGTCGTKTAAPSGRVRTRGQSAEEAGSRPHCGLVLLCTPPYLLVALTLEEWNWKSAFAPLPFPKCTSDKQLSEDFPTHFCGAQSVNQLAMIAGCARFRRANRLAGDHETKAVRSDTIRAPGRDRAAVMIVASAQTVAPVSPSAPSRGVWNEPSGMTGTRSVFASPIPLSNAAFALSPIGNLRLAALVGHKVKVTGRSRKKSPERWTFTT